MTLRQRVIHVILEITINTVSLDFRSQMLILEIPILDSNQQVIYQTQEAHSSFLKTNAFLDFLIRVYPILY